MAVWRVAKDRFGESDLGDIAGLFLRRFDIGHLIGLLAFDIGVAQPGILENLREQMERRVFVFF